MARDSRLLVPRAVAARILLTSVRGFERLEAAGVVKAEKVGTGGKASAYDLARIVPAYLRHVQAEKPELPRDARDRSQAELNQLKLARERRQLLPREDVVSEGQTYIAAVSAKLRSLPPRLIQAGAIPPASQEAVTAMVEESIAEMARWRTSLELLKAVEESA